MRLEVFRKLWDTMKYILSKKEKRSKYFSKWRDNTLINTKEKQAKQPLTL